MYGGIRTSSGLMGRATASFGASGAAANPAPSAGLMPGGAGTGFRQPNSPYNLQPDSAASPAGPAHAFLVGLVLLEAAALVGLRRGFRHHHGG